MYSDDRKDKQVKVAAEAKNDTLDKLEVDKRKVYFECLLYNKYLRLLFERVLEENSQLENTLLEIMKLPVYLDIAKQVSSFAVECKECKWKKICFGGCSYYRYMNGGTLNSPYYFCSSTKMILKHMAETIKEIDSSAINL